jgi:hypothetical protein
METNALLRAVLAGLRPSGPDDYGPHTDKVQKVLEFLRSGQLLRFSGSLDDRWFIPVHEVEQAKQLAYDPEEEAFHWEEDACLVWFAPVPEFAFQAPQVWEAFKPNLQGLNRAVGNLVSHHIPEDFRYVCYDSVFADFDEIAGVIAKFGQLDQFYDLVSQAYQQGGWPCGLTGGRPISDTEFSLDGRKMYVLWHPV